MNTFKDREKGFEKKFANDQEAEFKISAKRNKLLGSWVADILKYDEEKKKNYIEEMLNNDDPVIAGSDYVRAYSQLIGTYINNKFYSLGTDGFGRSDTRKNLRDFFEVDRNNIVLSSLYSLQQQGKLKSDIVEFINYIRLELKNILLIDIFSLTTPWYIKNIIQWNYFLLMNLFFLNTYFVWKKLDK